MLVFGTQIHIITFIFIVLETIMFLFQLFYYLFRPEDKARLYYLILLILLLFYNITGGLFPDPNIHIPIPIQEMIAYGSGFLMASYFPFYFYAAFELKSLRWHAYIGVPLFLMLPYLIFFVIVYAIDGQLDLIYGMIIPFIYAIVVLGKIFKAIRDKYQVNRNKHKYIEEIATYSAISPWASLAFFGFIEKSQATEVLCTNTGIIIISILFLRNSIKTARKEYERLLEIQKDGMLQHIPFENLNYYRLTKTETEIVLLIHKGLGNKEIADTLFISEETVKKHLYNTFKKVQVKNRSALLHKLQSANNNIAFK